MNVLMTYKPTGDPEGGDDRQATQHVLHISTSRVEDREASGRRSFRPWRKRTCFYTAWRNRTFGSQKCHPVTQSFAGRVATGKPGNGEAEE